MDNKEIAKQIAEFMGTPFRKPTHGSCCTCQHCGHYFDNCQCDYPVDIEMAFRAVDFMVGNQESNFYEWNFKLSNNYAGAEWCAIFEIDHFKESLRFYGEADTIPMAICLAIIEAIKDKE